MSEQSWAESMIAIAAILSFFAVIIVLIAQVGSTWRARLIASRDQAYRSLLEQSTRTQEQLVADLGILREQVSSIERLMKEVG
ncbi:MAG: hypothetical protein IBX64_12835 [Actinobacteria bacterium]|nr:hypothetical protein [Actinomycetota bacterium]